ncbi:MAG TPA: hypothetical protein VIJ27_08845 [Mucilaginibacter sp.]
MFNISKPSLKCKLIVLGIISFYLGSCNQQNADDNIKSNVIETVKNYFKDSVKNATIITFSNYCKVTKYDSVILSIRETKLDTIRTHLSLNEALERKQSMDNLAPLYNSMPLSEENKRSVINIYANINSSLKNDSDTFRLYAKIREILLTKLKDKSLQQKTACYKINCTYMDELSKIHAKEFILAPQFKITSKSEL